MPTIAEKKSKPAPLEYEAFIKSLKLNVISLKESACEIDRKAYWEHKERNITYKLTAESLEIEEDYFDVRAKVEVVMTGGKTKAPTPLIKISATYDLHFHAELIPKPLLQRFCNSDVRLIVWPYFREYVSDVSARMYIPPMILPLYD
jgi:preprotein translocase subunit SecB